MTLRRCADGRAERRHRDEDIGVIPDDIVAVLKERARREGRSVSSLSRRVPADSVSRPATNEDLTATQPAGEGR
jgi:hypothetical protein